MAVIINNSTMKTINRLIKWVGILFRRQVTMTDLQNAWLIPCYNITVEESYEEGEDREFFVSHTVHEWVHNLWREWMYWAVWRQQRTWYTDKRFPWVYVVGLPMSYVRKKSWAIYLNSAPTMKKDLPG
jgi:hypothetical protein